MKTDHYATLGLDHDCTTAQIRAAYRLLAKQIHPDLNQASCDAVAQTQALNSAYETLNDAVRRQAYDVELAHAEKAIRSRVSKAERNISQELHLRIDEFLRGTSREVRINDPENPNGRELYDLIIPPETAPGSRFRLPRDEGGVVVVRVRPLPHFQFKVRGPDLRCDLKITCKRAEQGGEEMFKGALGSMLRVKIPARVQRGEIVRLSGEGLPKPGGGRGDLLVRIVYRPEVRITRRAR